MYHVNYKWEVPVAAVFMGASYFGFRALDKHASYTEEDVKYLDPQNINAFDRPVAYFDPAGFDHAQKTSDLLLNISVVSPVLLAFDKRVRRDWADAITLFVFTHAVNNAVYFAAAGSIRRARPLTYNPALPIEEKIGEAKSNSFFSGHVSFSATSTFFMAKLFTDYHQIKGWKRLAIYTAAAVPPGLVGYYRMQAGKHFRTDVLTGLIVGATCGILVPELHRNKNKEPKWSMTPFFSPYSSGLTWTWVIK